MSAEISSFLKYKTKRDLIDPMYRNINMLSTIFRRENFKLEMELLVKMFEAFELFVVELEKNEWDQKKIPTEVKDDINSLIDQINFRAKVRNSELGR